MKHIICFHLLNDFSGSPKALATVLKALSENGVKIDLITSYGPGVLNSLATGENVKFHFFSNSAPNKNKILAFAKFCFKQIRLFFTALNIGRKEKDSNVFYINTIMPVSAAIAGKFLGKKVVYHYHENAFAKSSFYRVLATIMQHIADEIICVSAYQKHYLKRQEHVFTVPNALDPVFLTKLHPNPVLSFQNKRILMLASLRTYKGISEFVDLAQHLPQFCFELVLNASPQKTLQFAEQEHLSEFSNLKIYSRQDDVSPFYNRASIVLNLSNKNKVIETFGLTALEAMSAGLPVIVPTEGGIAEFVQDGVNGYKINVQNLDDIRVAIESLLSDKTLYISLAKNALETSHKYNVDKTAEKILRILF